MMTMLVKGRWESDGIQEETWESEPQMKIDYPELFRDDIGQSVGVANSGSNFLLVGENCNDPTLTPKAKELREREREREEVEIAPPGVLAGATTRQDVTPTAPRSEPGRALTRLQKTALRTRVKRTRHCRKSSPPFSAAARPPPEITSAVAAGQLSGKSPPVTDTGDSPAGRQLGRVDPVHQDHQILGQHDHQDPVQQVPLPQVPLQHGPAQQFAHGVQDLPPPPPRPQVYPVYDERFYRLTCQMRNMDMEHFSGTVDVVAAHDWKLALQRKLEIIECPPELSLRLTIHGHFRGRLDQKVFEWDASGDSQQVSHSHLPQIGRFGGESCGAGGRFGRGEETC
ncbi:hypothetical protein F2Q68_00032260 [Brassica cretica]|uniref:Uncharacterized protein n=1 Tax=Brassica cretica TaxID=69181 RepID=A0A8S9G9W1_BRACR|nr:hypothetical protein F2Q68_00032260 [Brassica cretica]